ncbi:MAG: hypothetical protein AAGC93_21360 [Cyanobacteria bacterium P01_F01_bin.53]
MDNNWVRLVILLSIFLLIAFPFVGLAPLTFLAFVAFCGLAFRLWNLLMAGGNEAEPE